MKAKTRNTIFISLGLLAGGSLFWFWWGRRKADDQFYAGMGQDLTADEMAMAAGGETGHALLPEQGIRVTSNGSATASYGSPGLALLPGSSARRQQTAMSVLPQQSAQTESFSPMIAPLSGGYFRG